MAISNNPTKTRTLEKSWYREINKRWSLFEKNIIEKFLSINDIQTNAKTVGMNAEQLRVYMAYLNEQIELLLLGRLPPLNWQNQYQLEAYQRGIERTRQSLMSQGVSIAPTAREQLKAQGLQAFTAKPSLTTAVMQMAPIHQEGLEFLFVRAYESLKGWTDDLSKEVRQITFDAIRDGDGVLATSKKIRERTGVSKSRAQLIASTETTSAYREAAIAETERAEEELGEEINMRWITARDNRVRHLHSKWHGTISTATETRKKGSISPYRCRCAQIPVIEGASDTPQQEEKFKAERATLLKEEATP